MMTAFTYFKYFMTLKTAVAYYHILRLEKVLKAPLDVSSHLYKIDL